MTLLDKIATSALGLLGKSPQKYNQVSQLDSPTASTSQLDRDGKTPKKYQDNLPR